MAPRDYLATSSLRFGRFAVWVHDHRWPVLLASLMVFALSAALAAKVAYDASLDAFFDAEDPTYQNYYEFRQDFGSDELAYILYTVPDVEHGVFDIKVMRKIAKLSEALELEVPFVKEVTSLSTAEFMQSEGDDIEVNEILRDFPESQQEMLRLRDIILSKDIYLKNIVSKDGRHGAIVVEMTRAATDPAELVKYDPEGGDGLDNLYPQVSAYAIRELLAREEYSGIEFYNVGDVEFNAVYNVVSFSEPVSQTALSIVVIMLLSVLLLRSGTALIGPLLVVLVALAMTIAFISAIGWEMDLLFSMTPNLLIAIGVAQAIHLLSEFQLARSRGLTRRDSLQETMELVGNPCLLAAVSTAAGFLAMAGSDLKGISHLSIYGAFGVMCTFLMTVTLLLSLLSFGGERQKTIRTSHGWISKFLNSAADTNIARPGLVIMISVVAFMVALLGLRELRVDFNFLTDFKPHMKVRQDTEYADQNMGGMLSLVYVFDAGTDGIKDPKNLAAMERFQEFASQQAHVEKTLSIVDTLKDLNQTFHGDDPAYYKLPDDRELIAQYLLMYELSGGDQLEEFVTSDFARAVVDLRVQMVPSSNIADLFETLETYVEETSSTNGLELTVEASGVGLLWVRMADYISSSFAQGYVLVFVMIFVLMCLIFRSLKVGALAMIPNFGPIVLTMGFMGWADINLDYIRMMIATIAIGIAVDDTVHLVTRFRQEFYRCGSYEKAMRNSLGGVGHALVITTIILISAFALYFTSQLSVMASFGSLLAVAISAALLSDLYLLPVLLMKFKPFGPEFDRLADDALHEAGDFGSENTGTA